MFQSKIKIIYKWQPFNKINGTLFYSFEYLIQLLLLDKEIEFCIYNITDINDIKMIIASFKDKYDGLDNVLNFIKYYPSGLQLAKLKDDCKIMFFDVYTFNDIGLFYKDNIKTLYINNNYANTSKQLIKQPNTQYFGYYDYQIVDENFNKSILKVGCKFQKRFSKGNNIFINENVKESNIPYERNHIYKQHDKIHKNLFDNIYKIIYIHNKIDTNNRIIVEGLYHQKEVMIIDITPLNDSVKHRFELGKQNIDQLILNEKDLMIQYIIGNENGTKIK